MKLSFLKGVMKSKFSYAPWWKSGGETLFVGVIASGAGYLIGYAFEPLVESSGASHGR